MRELIHVKGLPALDALLQALPAKVERNILRGALRAGANVIKPVAQSNIHSVSGETAKSVKVGTRARGGQVTASVYTKLFTAKFLEHGTRPHTITAKNRKGLSIGGLFFQSVQHPGTRPHPFLRPAMDTQAQAAVIAVGEYIKERLATREGIDTSDVFIQGDE